MKGTREGWSFERVNISLKAGKLALLNGTHSSKSTHFLPLFELPNNVEVRLKIIKETSFWRKGNLENKFQFSHCLIEEREGRYNKK